MIRLVLVHYSAFSGRELQGTDGRISSWGARNEQVKKEVTTTGRKQQALWLEQVEKSTQSAALKRDNSRVTGRKTIGRAEDSMERGRHMKDERWTLAGRSRTVDRAQEEQQAKSALRRDRGQLNCQSMSLLTNLLLGSDSHL
ncbi:hypothetical protein NDU88_000741 [Pleurodeles waltl]|uniref:Uncharacterized protein n=1 Tax=Pleurodeles waltl TaxID=8319 RepID=A0AAV7SXE2_PLEWA|nr:hypothetical protein NDU88_000741 [Pleurodeles waltl]